MINRDDKYQCNDDDCGIAPDDCIVIVSLLCVVVGDDNNNVSVSCKFHG